MSWLERAWEAELAYWNAQGRAARDALEDALEEARREGVMPTTPPDGGT